ncbi:hypothetical protein BGZ54_005087 [Gamsiella multidivaricata]|nr:hypothetical protein BGZ54_005087 [Gamsiella multidivaricata]
MGKRKGASSASNAQPVSDKKSRTNGHALLTGTSKEKRSDSPITTIAKAGSAVIPEGDSSARNHITTLAQPRSEKGAGSNGIPPVAVTGTAGSVIASAAKPLPRITIASGLVPRQVTRSKPVSSIGRNTLVIVADKSSSSSSKKKQGNVPATASVPAGGSSTDQAEKSIFRAKDIVQHWIPALPSSSEAVTVGSTSSLRPIAPGASTANRVRIGFGSVRPTVRSARADQEDTALVSPSTVTAAVNAAALAMTMATRTMTDTIIHAAPIVVHPEKHPHRKEYPYGNYPSYYEKRIEEQTKKPIQVSQPSLGTDRSGSMSGSGTGVRTKTGGDSSRKQVQDGLRWKAKLSVLFPPTDLWTKGSGGRMSLADLAKRVDLRLEFLDPTWFRGKRVLDIGCNSALLTVFIALHYKPKKIQGVDIDPSLIGKAQNFVLKTFSQISPDAYIQTHSRCHTDSNGSRNSSTNIDDDNDNEEGEGANQEDLPYEEYFPRAMYRIHGLLPVPERTSRTEVLFPHNIELRVADWVTETDNHQDAEAEQWDIIFAFSLTKWVHLHHGDAGLKRFFQKIYRSLAKGGILLLEPQAYETYNRRSKILPEMQTTYKEIAFRPEMFQEYLLGPEVGFREGRLLGHSEGRARNFNRDIYMYRK